MTPNGEPEDVALRELVRQTRLEANSSDQAPLDLLLRRVGSEPELDRLLRLHAGVGAVFTAEGYQPDYSRWAFIDARQSKCLVLVTSGGDRLIAALDPWDDTTLGRVFAVVGMDVPVAAVSGSLLQLWLSGAQGPTPGGQLQEAAAAAFEAEGPVVALVDQALQAAYKTGASDVHFECDRHGVRVKHRRDGVLVTFSTLHGVQSAQEVISRIKVLAKLDITERRLPQDGRFRFSVENQEVDVRVSIMPSVHGEDAVLRLLDKSQLRGSDQTVTLEALGFGVAEALDIRDLSRMPSGMILVTGPTGSGKTTTLYAALSEINTGSEKIVTIEDPVEYELPGVLQIPVNERKGLTFAKGLRSILRHDPDRILVGEIRDAETAEIAVQSALTGHLVFTTVHANNVADIIGRFRHFGMDMFGFMSALNGVVVQRLLRKLCPHCKLQAPFGHQDLQWFEKAGQPAPVRMFHAPGCGECGGSGYKGRFVLAEVHLVNDRLRDDVTQGAPISAVKAHALANGVRSLMTQAIEQISCGGTSMDEVRRVIGHG